ncbi:MAG: hypothetical protein SFU98_01400 [Leptospiraceae bacterium]|nr:hypothetical protein [Leptospiraceae bacterium]
MEKDNFNHKQNMIRENICENVINNAGLNIYKDQNKKYNLVFLGIPLDIATTGALTQYIHPIAGFIYFLFSYVHLAAERFPRFKGFKVFCGSVEKPSSPPFQYYYLKKIENRNLEKPDKCILEEDDKMEMLAELAFELNIQDSEKNIYESKYEYNTIKSKSNECFYVIKVSENKFL